jgi:nucleoside-diphosphate-sugar epimerase
MTSKRVLVTGSEGFTGIYVCQELRAAGWDVWGAGLAAKPDNPCYIQIDLQDAASLEQIAAIRPDVVIHLAALAFVAEPDPAPFYHINLLGTRNLLEALCQSKHPPDCTIIASSANVYGNAQAGMLSEDTPPNPVNDYAVSKLAMEYLARTYMDRLGIVITRPFNYTGVGQSDRFLIPKIVAHYKRRADVIELGNLNVAREFSDVRDIAQNYRLLAEHQPVGETLQLCSGEPLSLEDCLSIATRLSGRSIEVRVNPAFVRKSEVTRLSGDRRKLESLVPAAKPRTFEETLSWMLNQS